MAIVINFFNSHKLLNNLCHKYRTKRKDSLITRSNLSNIGNNNNIKIKINLTRLKTNLKKQTNVYNKKIVNLFKISKKN